MRTELESLLAGGSCPIDTPSTRDFLQQQLATGTVKITPEPRLNALMVLANRADQDTVKQLLTALE